MKQKEIAVVLGDGAAPEMMAVAMRVVKRAAELDDVEIKWVETPMGWNVYEKCGDTVPTESMGTIGRLGIVFFGGVGDPALDNTIGKEKPAMRPETKALLALRKRLGLVLNFRPMRLPKALKHLSPLRPELIPDEGINMFFVRFLAQDSYFGTEDLWEQIDFDERQALGLKKKNEVTGQEHQVTELAYYGRSTLLQYFEQIFQTAKEEKLPVISIDKSNVMPRYLFWRILAEETAKRYPEVPFQSILVDAANALLVNPKCLRGVIACGNEHGDILSDGGAAIVGGLGLMHSASTSMFGDTAMFESGAGTAPTLKGKDAANPIGRILTGALMLRHIGCVKGAEMIEFGVRKTLMEGYRTKDIAEPGRTKNIVGCEEIGGMVLIQVAN